MVVAVVLFVRKQFFVSEPAVVTDPPVPPKPDEQPALINEERLEFKSAEELEVFLKSDSSEHQDLRAMMRASQPIAK